MTGVSDGFGPSCKAHDVPGEARIRPPDGPISRTIGDAVEPEPTPLVLAGIVRLVGLYIGVPLSVAVGIDDERRPALRLAASPVSQNSFVLTQPTTASSFWVLLLSHSVWLASSPKFKWWVPKHVSMNVNCFVFGSYTVT